MTELLSKLKATFKGHGAVPQAGLQDELEELRRQLICTEACYNMARDSDLIESLIYQRGAIMARYEYLLKSAKAQNLRNSKARIST